MTLIRRLREQRTRERKEVPAQEQPPVLPPQPRPVRIDLSEVVYRLYDVRDLLRYVYSKAENIESLLEELSKTFDFGLANSEDWRWYQRTLKNETIASGGRRSWYSIEGSGYLYFFVLSVSDTDVRLKMDLGTSNVLHIDYTLSELDSLGASGLGQGFVQIVHWDEVNDVYVMGFASQSIGIPFNDGSKAEIINESGSDVTIRYADVWIIRTRW